MAASQYYKVTAYVGTPHRNAVEVTLPLVGPQGPAGPAGTGLETLTAPGDTLYQGASTGERLPIGSAGQVLKVVNGFPAWGNESGAVTSVNGETGAVVLDGSEIDTSGNDDYAAFFTYEFANGNGIYYPLPDVTLNNKRVYRSITGHHVFFENLRWHITDGSPVTENIIESSDDGNAAWPWLESWDGSIEKAKLSTIVGFARGTFRFIGDSVPSTSVSGLGTAATSDTGDFAAASHAHGNITNSGAIGTTANLPLKTGTNGVIEAGSFGTAAGSFCAGDDARLSDARTPSSTLAHKTSHATGGTDALAPSDIGAQSVFSLESLLVLSASQIDLTAARAKIFDIVQFAGQQVDVKLPSTNAMEGDVFVFRWGTGSDSIRIINSSSPAPITTVSVGEQKRLIRGSTDSWTIVPVDTHTHVVADVTGAAASGSITTSGLTQATARILGRTTASTGAVEEITIGSGLSLSAGELSSTVSAGVTAVGASTADVLSVSGSDLVADDGGLINSANPAVVWDDVAGKLVYANPLARPSGAGAMFIGLAPSTTALGTNAVYISPARTNENQVANGESSVCIGSSSRALFLGSTVVGAQSVAASTTTTAVGYANNSTGEFSTSLGHFCIASGSSSLAIGRAAEATAADSYAIGRGVVANLRGQVNTYTFNTIYWGGQTTNNTPLILNLDAAAATNRFTIAANTALAVDILLVARRSDTADKWLVARRFLGIRRDGSNNTSLIGAVQTLGTDQSDGSPTWSFTLTADDTNEALQLEVTGAASETIQWRATAFYRVA
jgi:hypothetical protein